MRIEDIINKIRSIDGVIITPITSSFPLQKSYSERLLNVNGVNGIAILKNGDVGILLTKEAYEDIMSNEGKNFSYLYTSISYMKLVPIVDYSEVNIMVAWVDRERNLKVTALVEGEDFIKLSTSLPKNDEFIYGIYNRFSKEIRGLVRLIFESSDTLRIIERNLIISLSDEDLIRIIQGGNKHLRVLL